MLIGTLFGVLGFYTNRIRGGLWKDFFMGSTQGVRFVWSFVFASVVFIGTTPAITFSEVGPWRFFLLVFTGFMSWAMFGSGAHSILDLAQWRKAWLRDMYPDDTEIYTQWLPRVFGGHPDLSWSESKFLLYHITGKGVEGVLRNVIAISPCIFLSPHMAGTYIVAGTLWGFLFYIADMMPTSWSVRGWTLGEGLTGFLQFFVLGVLLYV